MTTTRDATTGAQSSLDAVADSVAVLLWALQAGRPAPVVCHLLQRAAGTIGVALHDLHLDRADERGELVLRAEPPIRSAP